MTWVAASPTRIDGFVGATKHFATDNSQGVCAGFSQTWLTLSLIGGQPLTNAGLMSNSNQISSFHQGRARVGGPRSFTPLGNASATTLPESGLKIATGYPFKPSSTGWQDIFDSLAARPDGYYYLTIKAPFVHAMACIMQGFKAFYLEPQSGLYEIAKSRLSESLTGFYSKYTWSAANDYKIYKVTN